MSNDLLDEARNWLAKHGQKDVRWSLISKLVDDLERASTRETRLECALILAAKQFRHYAELHRAKLPPDKRKAATNDEYAAMCDAALYATTPQTGEGEK